MQITSPRWAERWQAECERAVYNAGTLLRLAGRRSPFSAVAVDVLRSAPRSPDEAQGTDEPLFARVARAVIHFTPPCECDLLDSVLSYFQKLAAMRPARRALLEEPVAGALIGHAMGG